MGRAPSRIAVSDDERYVAVANADASAGERGYVFDAETGEMLMNTYVERSFTSLAISPDRALVTAGGANKQVHLQAVGGSRRGSIHGRSRRRGRGTSRSAPTAAGSCRPAMT